MQFTHRPFDPHATIAAIATPPGEGGVAIIRISGEHALEVAGVVFSRPIKNLRSHTAYFGKFKSCEGTTIDEGLCLVMRNPKSYTGEDVVEFHCHGGSLISRHLLEAVLRAGARMAEPGEFTRKAFLNGKMDLAQAEAVQTLISAKNNLALQSAETQLDGHLSKKIISFQEGLTDVAAILEAWVDFPEEGLEFASLEEIVQKLEGVCFDMEKLEASFSQGKMLHEGFSLCLAGRPNAGKSSLMNALLGEERAIVTPIPGTTRDVLQEELRLGELHFRLLDTAGIRETEEVIEKEGIRRTKLAMEKADLVLFVVDGTKGLADEDLPLLPKDKTIIIWNKTDLEQVLPICNSGLPVVKLSAKKGEGIEALQQTIESVLWENGLPSKEEVILTNSRHKEALNRAISALRQLIKGLQTDISPEFLSADMRFALTELGTIIGRDITEDILNAIFSKFCIGK